MHYEPLTARQAEITKLLVAGYRNHEIATLLGLSRRTIESHRSHIYEKMSVRNGAQLILVASRHYGIK